ncbi:hypothetical protein ACIQ9J_01815 [Streptomyces sp. NPDC094153]|uniref:hypothetical protein n=1 Tax=Streptomyces sp. NPDC094153 TaxID=3366058 RepID=UPI0037F86865
MAETITRRAYLLAAIRAAGRPVRTGDAERLLAASPWSCHRNTARKDLRGLARAGHLAVIVDVDDRHTYILPTRTGDL